MRLEVAWEGRWASLRENLRTLLLERAPTPAGRSAAVWFRDAIAAGVLPGRALLLSALLHTLFVVAPLPGFLTAPPQRLPPGMFRIEYDLEWTSPYELPPIAPKRAQTQPAAPPKPEKESPVEVAKASPAQTILSQPPAPNHPTQTLLTAFRAAALRPRLVRLPNIVIPPAPNPAPTPAARLLTRPAFSPLLEPARPGEILLAETKLEKLRPRLLAPTGQKTVAPPPALAEPKVTGLPGGLVALSINPARPTPTLQIPETRLRARFAVGPKQAAGKQQEAANPIALRVPDVVVSGGRRAGLAGPAIVGPAPPPPRPTLPARPRGARRAPKQTEPQKPPQERARKLLAALTPGLRPGTSMRRVYTTYINMPNLTSQSSTWLLRFAEFAPANANSADNADDGNEAGTGISAPLVVKKVDPRYPAAARRERVEGMVVLYAVIRTDGGVEDVAVVRGVDTRLDQSAAEAFARWHFQPATRKGRPIAVEVIIEIPFRLTALL